MDGKGKFTWVNGNIYEVKIIYFRENLNIVRKREKENLHGLMETFMRLKKYILGRI